MMLQQKYELAKAACVAKVYAGLFWGKASKKKD